MFDYCVWLVFLLYIEWCLLCVGELGYGVCCEWCGDGVKCVDIGWVCGFVMVLGGCLDCCVEDLCGGCDGVGLGLELCCDLLCY